MTAKGAPGVELVEDRLAVVHVVNHVIQRADHGPWIHVAVIPSAVKCFPLACSFMISPAVLRGTPRSPAAKDEANSNQSTT
jgi:hypothetical protein